MLSRRDLMRGAAGAGALGLLGSLGASAVAAQGDSYRAMVAVFLLGGCDGWNLVVPTDNRYAAYAKGRGAPLALKAESLTALTGTPFGLHPSLMPLKPFWDRGSLNLVLNTGSLYQPLNRSLFNDHPELRPLNYMSHAHGQGQWQGMRARANNGDGFLGRIADQMAGSPAVSPLISIAGSNIAVIGKRAAPLVLPAVGDMARSGFVASGADAATSLRQAAITSLSDTADLGALTQISSNAISNGYVQAAVADSIISAPASKVDAYFVDPATGAPLQSSIAAQLRRAARMIEARNVLGHPKQAFFVTHGSYDTHSQQVDAQDSAKGTQADLFTELAQALAAFQNAVDGLGLARNVTTFTMSDFGRGYRGNGSNGTDHAWGNNHMVLGGALAAPRVHGRYPDQTFGGPEDSTTDGRWIPSIAVEEYIGGIVNWFGVAPADLPYIFPNWATWTSNGRGPVPLFG